MSESGRRAYDRDIDPVVEGFVERRLADTRHDLRAEATAATLALTNKLDALQAKVEAATLQSTTEHTVVTAHLERLTEIQASMIEEIKGLANRTAVLERSDSSRTSIGADRRWLIGTALAVIGAMAAIVAIMPH